MNICKTCKHRTSKGYCNSDKISEGEYNYDHEDRKDMLIYSHIDQGVFLAGENFWCVHHEPND